MDRKSRVALALAGIVLLAGCGETKTAYPDRQDGDRTPTWSNEKPPEYKESIFGPGGLTLFGGDKKKNEEAGQGIGVNTFLWRASLDTIGFMPLASADPFGGVIITDWYSPPETPNERFKMSVYIMDRTLRADGIRVAVFRQTKGPAGDWVDAAVEQKTATDLENAILTRAREMRTASNAQK
jgi:hypothetical protein